jgi:hypothetical protein
MGIAMAGVVFILCGAWSPCAMAQDTTELVSSDSVLEVDNGETASSHTASSTEETIDIKEAEGVIKEVNSDYVIMSVEGVREIQLMVDADTLIYVDDIKSTIASVQPGDDAFAYYMEENGSLKCDWLEISR